MLLLHNMHEKLIMELQGHLVECMYLRESCSDGSRLIKVLYNQASLQRWAVKPF